MEFVVRTSLVCLVVAVAVSAVLLVIASVFAALSDKPAPGEPLKPRIRKGLLRFPLLICLVVTPVILLHRSPGMSQAQQIDSVLINTQLIILLLILATPTAAAVPPGTAAEARKGSDIPKP